MRAAIGDEIDLSRLRLLPLARSIAEADLGAAAEMIDSDPQVRSQAQAMRAELRETVTGIVGGEGRGGRGRAEGTSTAHELTRDLSLEGGHVIHRVGPHGAASADARCGCGCPTG